MKSSMAPSHLLFFSACGGMGKEASVVVKRLADALAMKHNENYSRVITWMRCCLAFSLARSAIRCVRGSRSISRRTHRQAWSWQRLGWSWHRYSLSLVLSCLLCVSCHFTVFISSFSIFILIFILFYYFTHYVYTFYIH